MKQTKFPGIFEIKKKKRILLTKNLVPGKVVYTEELVKEGKDEYRTWDPFKSKLAAASRVIITFINQIINFFSYSTFYTTLKKVQLLNNNFCSTKNQLYSFTTIKSGDIK